MNDDPLHSTRDEDSPWLWEQVEDEEILALFTDDSDRLQKAVRHLLARAEEDQHMESCLIEVLEIALDEGCDNTSASMWIALILGEARSRNSIGLLIRCLTNDDNEDLQDAAGVALLRIGTPAIIVLMEAVDEERGVQFDRGAYRLLGDTGVIQDETINHRVAEFLEERFPLERRTDRGEDAMVELAAASSRLGLRNLLVPLKKLLAKKYSGSHPLLEDAISALEDNEAGVPFVPTMPPWEERYGWLFDDQRDGARVERSGVDSFLQFPGAGESLEEDGREGEAPAEPRLR